MKDRQFGLATIQAFEEGANLHAEFVENPYGLCLRQYSEFKYGNGAVANKLGSFLAQQFLDVADGDHTEVLVTSSAYKSAPPAARALQDSFVENIRTLSGEEESVSTFKIYRSNLTNGDYAAMSLEQRQEVMASNGLVLPADLDITDRDIVILDDISVTGSHEELLRNLLAPLNPNSMHYGYVLSVLNGKAFPGIEAAINATSVRSLDDIIWLIESPEFIPNARFCKFILSQQLSEIERFIQVAPPTLLEVMSRYIQEDDLAKISSYQAQAEFFIDSCRSLKLETV